MNLSFDQSREAQINLDCELILAAYSSFHSHTFSKNFSLPSETLVIHSFASFFSTTLCVAIQAWSVPGTHRVSSHLSL